MRAWLFQDHRQKTKLGDKAPWSVGWVDPAGGRRSKRVGSKSMAEKFRKKKEGELAAGLCRVGPEKVAWKKFCDEYKDTIIPKWRSVASRTSATAALARFEELVKPTHITAVDKKALDKFVAKRLKMRGKRKGDSVSPETVKKELRTLRAPAQRTGAI